jgi:hypothetical protein
MMCRLIVSSIGLAVSVLLSCASGARAGQPSPSSALCVDSAGDLYSEGAMVEVGGRLMQCVIGSHWKPVDGADTDSNPTVLDVSRDNIEARVEASIVEALRAKPLPSLQCDSVLNSELSPKQLLHVPSESQLLMYF